MCKFSVPIGLLLLFAFHAEGQITLVQDIRSGSIHSHPRDLFPIGSNVLFSCDDGTHGRELWISDGTSAGTQLLKDIRAGASSSFPAEMVALNGKVLFLADDGANGKELWITDGTELGTQLVKDINPGASGSFPEGLYSNGQYAVLSASDGTNGQELWVTDGTAQNTILLADIDPGNAGSHPEFMTDMNGVVYFAAHGPTNSVGTELYRTDGTPAGTWLVRNIHTKGPAGVNGSSFPRHLHAVGSTLYFYANDSTHGSELWKTNGDSASTVMVMDIMPGKLTSVGGAMATLGNAVVFPADDGIHGLEIWMSDGANTSMIKDIFTGTGDAEPTQLRTLNGQVFFVASSDPTDREPYITDGTSGGTLRLADIFTGTGGSAPGAGVIFGGNLYFPAGSSNEGYELWQTDGTPGGTGLVMDLFVGTSSAFAFNPPTHRALAATSSTVFMAAQAAGTGYELFQLGTSGLPAQTTVHHRIYPNPASDVLHIEDWRPGVSLRLHDMLGQELLIPSAASIPVYHLLPGMYILTLDNGKQRTSIPLTISKP